MDYRKLIDRQAHLNLPEDLRNRTEVQNLLQVVTQTYLAFEKEKDLLSRSFLMTEQEYIEVNNNLKEEILNRRETIAQLKELVIHTPAHEEKNNGDSLKDFYSMITSEIERRQQAENTLKNLINNLNQGIILRDSGGQVLYVNEVLLDLFELQSSDRQNLCNVLEKINTIRSQAMMLTDGYLKVTKSSGYKTRLWSYNQDRLIEEAVIPFLYADNKRGFIYTFMDVTERERSNELIRKAQLRSMQILEGSPDAVILTDDLGNIRFSNSRTLHVFGWTEVEILGLNVRELLPNADFISAFDNGSPLVEDELGVLREVDFINRSNETRWLECSVNRIEELAESKYCFFFRDVTERKLAQMELVRQQKFIQEMLDNIPNDIGVLDEEQRYLFVNEAAVKDPDMRKWVIGKSVAEYCRHRGISEDFSRKRRAFFDQALQTQQDVDWVDEHMLPGGKIKYMQRKYHPYLSEGKYPVVIGYGFDITDNVNSKKELEASLVYAQQVNRELEQFAFVASHDLQEPIRTVSNFMSLLERRMQDKLDERSMKYIELTKNAATRMRQLVLDLLDYSRVVRTDDTVKTEPVDTALVVAEVAKLLDKQISEKGAVIRCSGLPVIHSRFNDVMRIFQNLIGNGIKYSRLDVAPEITVTATDLGDYWQFSVRDNGIGIEQEYLEKIFVLFQRLHQDNKISGTGIGLAVTKKLIDKMNGKIWVESVPGAGSTFHFNLPKK